MTNSWHRQLVTDRFNEIGGIAVRTENALAPFVKRASRQGHAASTQAVRERRYDVGARPDQARRSVLHAMRWRAHRAENPCPSSWNSRLAIHRKSDAAMTPSSKQSPEYRLMRAPLGAVAALPLVNFDAPIERPCSVDPSKKETLQ
jgi:hypothetical protein